MLRNVVCSLQRKSTLSSFNRCTCRKVTQVYFYWPGLTFTSWIQMVIVTNVGVFDNVILPGSTQASAWNEMFYRGIISRHSGTVEGALKNMELVKVKEGWITAQGQRSNVKGAAEIHGCYVRVSMPVTVWRWLGSELLLVRRSSCRVLMWCRVFDCCAVV